MADPCYICNSDRFVDDHHYDCREGKLSPETVPFCRRCHRTYHDLGVDYFEDEYLDKIIEVENKRREIWQLSKYGRVLPPLKREDIRRSDYWNKTHGITERKEKKEKRAEQLLLPMEVGEGRLYSMNKPNLL